MSSLFFFFFESSPSVCFFSCDINDTKCICALSLYGKVICWVSDPNKYFILINSQKRAFKQEIISFPVFMVKI